MVQNKKRLVSLILMLTLLVASVAALGISASAEEATYEKVTTEPSDWSGTYLIVYEAGAGSLAFNGSLSSFDAVSNTKSVTISDGTITGNLSDYTFTIAASGKGYSIQGASGKYIGNGSNSNALTTSNSALVNTLSINSDGTVNIIGSGGAYLRYNNTSGQTRFRYYKSTTYTSQKAICLYKLVENAGGGDTHTHSYNSEVTTAATCTTAGVMTYTCSCNDTYTEAIAATGHNYSNGACSVCGEAEPEQPDELTKTYTFSTYLAGTQFAENEAHELDEHITVTTTQCHFTSELRIYSSSTNNGYAIISSDRVFTNLGFNAGNKADTINVYGSTDGSTWTLVRGVAVVSTYKDYTVEISETSGYKYLKLDVAGTNQVRLKSITVTTVKASENACQHVWPETGIVVEPATCTDNGVEKLTCTVCGDEMEKQISATGHNYSEEGTVTKDPGCKTTGTMEYSCTNTDCDAVNTEEIPATGHNYVGGVCSCGAEELNLSGMYYIAAIRENENYQYMTSDLGTANTKRYQIVDSGLTELPESVEYTTDALQVFILEKAEGADKYYIYAVGATTDECYLGWSSGNSGKLVEKEDAIAFTVDVNDDGTYNIHFTASDGERTLALNENSDYDYFAMYKSGQCQNLSLVPVDFCCKFLGAGIRFQEYVDGELTDCPTDAVDIRFGWKFFKGEDVEFSWSWDYRLGDNGTEVTGQKGQFITEDLVTNAVFTNVSYNNLAKSIYIKINVTVNGTTYAAADYETRTVLAVLEVLASGDNNATSYAKSVLYAYDPDEYVAYAPSKEESAE